MHPDARHKLPLVVIGLWCVAMFGVRVWYADRTTFSFLLWNLFLAAVPVTLAYVLRLLSARRTAAPLQVLVFVGWLAFLPNAPYLVTDFIHLDSRPPVPLWFDVAMLASFAAAGVVYGYSSVADVETVVADRFGRGVGLAVALTSLGLCGFGIYLGRFLRWNTWDLVASPIALGREVAGYLANPFADPRAFLVSAIYGAALMLGYGVLHGLARSLPGVRAERRS